MTTQNNTAAVPNRNCWFLNEPFRKNAVYQQLTGMNYKYVLGLDIGHGETVVYLGTMKVRERKDKSQEIYPDIDKTSANTEGDSRIATMIAFNGEKVITGYTAKKYADFYQHFKTEPAKWADPYRARNFGSLMEAFIRELWNGIKQYNPKVEVAANNGELLIAVGCPSSPVWTNENAVQKYRDLIERATGCSHVTVLAESTAAIMSAVLDINEINKNLTEKKVICLNRGLAVIDAGSSTVDFTYILLGKKLITRSMTVAGRNLDEQILATILDNQKTNDVSIPEDQKSYAMVQIRQIKEDFYPEQISLGPKTIQTWDRNAPENGIELKFVADEKLMDSALNRPAIRQDPFKPALSWAEQYRKFVRDCRALIGYGEDNELLCDKVILTGGTSNVPLLRKIAEEVFPECEILDSRDSSASVSKGLCYAKCMEIKGGSAVENYKKETAQLAGKNYEAFIDDLADYLAEEASSDIRQVIATCVGSKNKVVAGALLDQVNKRIRGNAKLTGDACRNKVEELYVKHFQHAQEELHKQANLVSKNIYGADNTSVPELPPMSADEIRQMISRLDISGVLNNTWLSTIVEGINFATITNMLFFLGCATMEFPPLGLSLLALSLLSTVSEVQQGIMKFIVQNKTVIPPWMLRRIARKMTDAEERAKMVDDSARKTAKRMKKQGFLKEGFVTGVSDQAEIALGKVLFLVYEEKPDTQ